MKANRVLIKLFIPMIEQQYDVWIPLEKPIYIIVKLLTQKVNELSRGHYQVKETPVLYDKITGKPFDPKITVKEANIRNSTEVILV
jgi:hypothetical protein